MKFDDYCVASKTDKSSKSHDFCNFYDENINLNKMKSILEVGVKHGASLISWASFLASGADPCAIKNIKGRKNV